MLVRRLFVLVVLGALCLCACDGGSENGSKTGGSGSVSKASDSGRVLTLEDGRREALKYPTDSDDDGRSGWVNNAAVCDLLTEGTEKTPPLLELLSNAFEPEGYPPLALTLLHYSLESSDGVLHERLVDLAAPFEAEFLEVTGKGTFDFDYDYASDAAYAVVGVCDDITSSSPW